MRYEYLIVVKARAGKNLGFLEKVFYVFQISVYK